LTNNEILHIIDIPLISEREIMNMSTLRDLREQAGLTAFDLAAQADVSLSTINRMERGDAVTRLIAYKVLNTLSNRLGRKIDIGDVEGLNIK
jgi:transcriptional regulator with XRE-family HTH domain